MRKKQCVFRFRQWPVWALVAVLTFVSGEVCAMTPMAKIASVEGKVWITRYGSKTAFPAELGESLFPGDIIRTENGKCSVNFTTVGFVRLIPNMAMRLPTGPETDKISLKRMLIGKSVTNIKQLLADEVFEVRGLPPDSEPAPAEVVAQRAKEDEARVAAERNKRLASLPEAADAEKFVAQYRSLLPAVLQAEKKPWHTHIDLSANAVKTGNGYRVAYKTYCLIESGPDKGKDYACYELDTVLELDAIKAAVADMKRRLRQ